MASIIRKLRVQLLQEEIEASRAYCALLVNQFETALTNGEKTKIAQRYDDALKHSQMMQLTMELLERINRKGKSAERPLLDRRCYESPTGVQVALPGRNKFCDLDHDHSPQRLYSPI